MSKWEEAHKERAAIGVQGEMRIAGWLSSARVTRESVRARRGEVFPEASKELCLSYAGTPRGFTCSRMNFTMSSMGVPG